MASNQTAADTWRLKAAILCWDQPPDNFLSLSLSLSQAEEIKVLAGDRSGFQGSGPSVAGMKCMVLNDHMDDKLSYCLNMKTKQDVNKKSYTVVVGKTEQSKTVGRDNKTDG